MLYYVRGKLVVLKNTVAFFMVHESGISRNAVARDCSFPMVGAGKCYCHRPHYHSFFVNFSISPLTWRILLINFS